MKSYKLIRERLGENKSSFSVLLKKSLAAYCLAEKIGRKIEPDDLKIIRDHCLQNGINDSELLDFLTTRIPRIERKKRRKNKKTTTSI